MSLILQPKFLLARQQFLLSAAMSLGLYDFLNNYDLTEELSIKWPNDLYIGTKKIAGVLIENTLRGAYLDWSIIGMGININQTFFDPTLPNPTSLSLELNKKVEINDCLFQLYQALERQYLRMQAGKAKEILEDYTQKLFQVNKKALYRILSEGTVVEGVLKGVDESGKMLLAFEKKILAYDLKEISPVL
jgi:BirA family biotin operon repressor/biotin-[acetyl-CoA-carboxylase] ligase